MISRYKIVSLVVIFFLVLSCNKTTTKEATEENKVNTEKINSDIFPHEKNFFKNHGASYLVNKDQCLSCHGVDGSGGSANVSCTKCHQDGGGRFPHPKNWVMADQHSTEFMKSPQSCSTCHGADWKGGTSKVSCLQCHENYPHPLKWSSPENHGKAYVLIKEKKDCLNCHQSNKVPANATRCDSCHKAYPHEIGFGPRKKHKVLAQTYDGKCLNCHQDYKANMPNYQDESEGVGCINCHEGTIQLKWKTPEEDKKTGALNTFKKGRLPSGSPHKTNKKNK